MKVKAFNISSYLFSVGEQSCLPVPVLILKIIFSGKRFIHMEFRFACVLMFVVSNFHIVHSSGVHILLIILNLA